MGGLSILLIALGAILAFAVNAAVDNVNLVAVGIILMVVGAIGLIVSVMRGSFYGFRSERHVSPDGRHVVEETHTTV
jgi:uncharacterized protein DUF6458